MATFRSFLILGALLFSQIIIAQTEKLPVNPDVTIGTLKNGIHYYILQNKKPEKRAELRLVVNAGSVLENDDQKGLAHFVEHMAFNGTNHFKKNELINYLESIGVKFGPELNAFTSFDETVYMLQVPTDSQAIMQKAFLVLEDWAHGLAFDSTEIEKERGVITEEWRLGRGAQMRMLDKQLPILFKDSKYADRLTIGDINIIKSFTHPTLTSYYKDWYRPDLMAVVAVGDFDKAEIETLIKNHFENIEVPENERARELYPVPSQQGTRFAIASDKEAMYSSVALYYKQEPDAVTTVDDYRKTITYQLFGSMFNERLRELTQLADPPFAFAFAGRGRMVRTADVNFLQAMVKDNGIERGLEVLLREAERVRKHGFTQSELDRHKKNLLRQIEKQKDEKDKTESSSLIWQFVSNYLKGDPIPGIENTFALTNKLVPGITLEDVNKLSSELIKADNRVVLVNCPEKEGIKIPTEADLTAVLEKVGKEIVDAYKDKTLEQPLVKNLAAASPVISETKSEKLGTIEWKLANGIKVIVKPTDFKNDEITFSAFSPGGSSLVDDQTFKAANSAVDILGEAGLGDFSINELQKALAGKVASANPYIDNYSEGLNGACSPKDAETMFQLIYLKFTSPRLDTTSFQSYKAKMKAYLQNYSNEPRVAFNDTMMVTMASYHPRVQPWSLKRLDEMDLIKSFNFYRDRFADASDFTFVFAGNIDLLSFKPFVEKYLGSLPSLKRNETWKDIHVKAIETKIEKVVKKGIEQKSTVGISFPAPFEWNRSNEYLMESLIDVLNIRLREVVREDKGGTYGIGIYHQFYRIPTTKVTISINFGCDPKRVDELTTAVFNVIDSLKNFGTTPETLVKVKETQKRQREVKLKQNRFWVGVLSNYIMNDEDPMEMLKYDSWIEKLTNDDIKAYANKYLDMNKFVKVVLLPEK
ncbi:MAG: insulinase family protein [Ignavibacteriaceae bacterium]|nr:insulinase family protein [Ignavibacteriaceae bacterium]